MFGHREPDDSSEQLVRLNLSASDQELAEKAAKQERRLEGMMGSSAIAFILSSALSLFFAVEYWNATSMLDDLIERGQRTRAIRHGEPVRIDPRMGRDYWRIEFSFVVEGRTYRGRTGVYRLPAPLVVVFDPRDPTRHRLVDSINPQARHATTLISWVITALAFLFFYWQSRRRLAVHRQDRV